MTTLYLIRGVSGSGKSTFANQLKKSGLVVVVLEADDYFTDHFGNYNFDAQMLTQAHRVCQQRTKEYLQGGFSVAVSNTSTTEAEVRTYKDIADECDVDFVSVIIENRHQGVNTHGVPEEKIQQMRQRFSVKL